jgi:hypothetical protein
LLIDPDTNRYARAVTTEIASTNVWRLYGDQDPQILGAGHSHARNLLTAIEAGLGPAGVRCAVAFTTDREPPTRDDYWDYVAELAAGRTLAVVWNGNQHNSAFMLRHRPPFRVYRPGGIELGPEEGAWLPRVLFREAWDSTFDGLRALLRRVVPIAQVLVVCTPPPNPEALVRSVLLEEPHFIRLAAELGYDLDNLQITPEPVRVALWSVLVEMLEDVAVTEGATFVPVPDGVTSADGLLLPEFGAGDVTHAGPAYGGRVWGQLSSLAALPGPAPR